VQELIDFWNGLDVSTVLIYTIMVLKKKLKMTSYLAFQVDLIMDLIQVKYLMNHLRSGE